MADASRPPGPLAPLRTPLFRALWIASTASNVGTWIQSVGEKWQMAELTTSPLLMSLIETGTTLPMLLLALTAGALADIVDRRRLLIAVQTYMMAVAAALSALTFLGLITPLVLVSMSLLLGIGAALTGPAWQANVPEILPREDVIAGVSLNSAGFNISRAVGPALGGLVVAALGPGFAFLLNAISFLGVVVVLVRWRREPTKLDLPTERFWSAIRLGLRYAHYSGPLRIILTRASGYVFFAGVVFSLTPTLAIHHLHLSSAAFGLLLGAIGAGAVTATLALPALRGRHEPETLLAAFTLLGGASLVILGGLQHWLAAAVALFVSGACWLSVLSTLNTAVQLSVPSWVRARAFGAYITAWGGALAVGATFWGVVAEHVGLRTTFLACAGGLVLFLAATYKLKVDALSETLDMAPYRQEPHPPHPIDPEDGPILVELRYSIPRESVPAFRDAMKAVRRIRVRDGAVRWSLFEDRGAGDGSVEFLESFFSDSWGEHLREHHRATRADRAVFDRAYKLDPEGRPRVKHLVAAW